ncbi:glycosyltransferase [Arthrobacter gengyunqii]|uniref:Glycosyltransferase n=1 Tax=Arthrobacter gengyunqii TaxID=2886940 RepID=A0ABS8GKE5_9MICC|nr:glycosyltransferase [Arthrobacter gengyunqii]MCC3267159.1 glycosyltransferase [Arthrobacter gengyunqii]
MTDADIGGAEVVVETMGRSLLPGDEAELAVLMGRGSMSERLEKAFARVHYLDFAPSSRDLPGMVRALERVRRRFQPDVIHSHLFHADLVTVLLPASGAAKVSTIHTQGFSKADHILTRLISRAVGLLSFRFDAVVPTGEACLRFGESYRYRRLSVPIDNTAPIPPENTYNPRSTMLLSLARWHPVKGHSVLLEAFRRLLETHPDWTLACVGPGASEGNPDAVQAVKTAGLQDSLDDGRVQLRGPTENVSVVLREAGALVISSLYGETFPVVGVEANASGVPVIATRVGECGQFVASPAHLVPPGDAGALADALRNFADLSTLERTGLSKVVRTRAENEFSPGTAAHKYRDVYQKALARKGTR